MGVAMIEKQFPKMRKQGYRITSVGTPDYNCFAWAVGIISQWWSPEVEDGYHWPTDVPRKLEVKTFLRLYELTGGYLPCISREFERGFEKIALYANDVGQPTHAAKQMESGKWSSKLGDWEDVEHATLEALEGDFYGKVAQILKRPVK
jgi:hypothetical protein